MPIHFHRGSGQLGGATLQLFIVGLLTVAAGPTASTSFAADASPHRPSAAASLSLAVALVSIGGAILAPAWRIFAAWSRFGASGGFRSLRRLDHFRFRIGCHQ